MPYDVAGVSLVAQMVENLPAMQETWVQSLDQEDLLEEEMAIHSSILAWKIPLTDTGYSPWSCKESGRTEHLTDTLFNLGSNAFSTFLCSIIKP